MTQSEELEKEDSTNTNTSNEIPIIPYKTLIQDSLLQKNLDLSKKEVNNP